MAPETIQHDCILIIRPVESVDSLAAREFERFLDDSVTE